MSGFSFFKTALNIEGIIAVGYFESYVIFVVRFPKYGVDKLRYVSKNYRETCFEDRIELDSNNIVATLRNDTKVTSKGIITYGNGKIGVAGSVTFTPEQTYLNPNSELIFLHSYKAAVTSFSPNDNKIVLAFEKSIDWQNVLNIQIENYKARFKEGASTHNM